MAKFLCECGHQLSLSGPIPHPDHWLLVSEVDFDATAEAGGPQEMYRRATIVVRCPRSDHLWVFWDDVDATPALYTRTPHNRVF